MEITMPLHELATKMRFWQPRSTGQIHEKNKFQDMVLVSSAFLYDVYFMCLAFFISFLLGNKYI